MKTLAINAGGRRWQALPAMLLLALLLTIPSITSFAADKQGDRERAALSRAQEAVRKAEREKQLLLQEKKSLQDSQAKAESTLKESDVRLQTIRYELARSRKAAEDNANSLELLRKEKLHLASTVEALQTQLRTLSEQRDAALKTIEARDADLGTVRKVSQERARFNVICEDKNTKLFQLTEDLIGHYEDRGFWASMLTNELFVQQKRVELENLMESYRDKIRAERVGVPSLGK